jgi:hypothetical protein
MVEANYTNATPLCTSDHLGILKLMHEYQGAHWGVDKTYRRINEHYPLLNTREEWEHMRRDVRDYVRQCPTCQKMSHVRTAVQATRFTLASYAPMTKISMDTTGLMEPDAKKTQNVLDDENILARYSSYQDGVNKRIKNCLTNRPGVGQMRRT